MGDVKERIRTVYYHLIIIELKKPLAVSRKTMIEYNFYFVQQKTSIFMQKRHVSACHKPSLGTAYICIQNTRHTTMS